MWAVGTRINLGQQVTQENSLHAVIPRPRMIPCPGMVTPRLGASPSSGCSGHPDQGFSSQKAPGALPWDPSDPRTLILPKKNPTKSLRNPTTGPAPSWGGCGAKTPRALRALLDTHPVLPAQIPTQPRCTQPLSSTAHLVFIHQKAGAPRGSS